MTCAPSEDSDQPGHPPSLIRVFAVRMKPHWVLSYPLSPQRRLWSVCAVAQVDLSLRWAHMPFCLFCHELALLGKDGSGRFACRLFVVARFSTRPLGARGGLRSLIVALTGDLFVVFLWFGDWVDVSCILESWCWCLLISLILHFSLSPNLKKK